MWKIRYQQSPIFGDPVIHVNLQNSQKSQKKDLSQFKIITEKGCLNQIKKSFLECDLNQVQIVNQILFKTFFLQFVILFNGLLTYLASKVAASRNYHLYIS